MNNNGGVKKLLVILVIAMTVGIVAIVVKNYQAKNRNLKNEEKPLAQEAVTEAAIKEIDKSFLTINSDDFVLGDLNAPITIIEYASLSCPHCASFYREAFEKLRSEYIDLNKVKFIYRDFPLNQQALVASMSAICRARDEGSDKVAAYYAIIKALFKSQETWAFDQKYVEKLQSILSLDGMSQSRFKSCLDDKKLQDKILENRIAASNALKISSTPTFYINDEVVEGYVDYESIKKVIDKKLNQ